MTMISLLVLANVAGGPTAPPPSFYAVMEPARWTASFADAAPPSTLLAAGDGLAWLVDHATGVMVALGAGGEVIRTIALPAAEVAPGHPRPLLLAPFPGGVWLWEVAAERGFVWFEGSWHGPFPLAGRVAAMTALADGSAVLNTPAHPAGSFVVLDRGGTPRARFGSPPAAAHPELAEFYDTWVLGAVEHGFVAAGRYLPRLVRFRRDGTKVWERIPQESGLAALERSRLARLGSLRRDCTSGCIDVELVEFASMGQGFADGSLAVVFSRRTRVDWFSGDGRWQGASRLELPTQAVLAPVGIAVVGDQLLIGADGALARFRAATASGGQVVDGDLAPVAGALVSLTIGEVTRLETPTADDGAFAVPPELLELSATLAVKGAGFLPWRRTGVVAELLRERIILEREPVVCVQAVQRRGGAPLRRFFVNVAQMVVSAEFASYRAGPPPAEVESEDGRYCLAAAWLPPLQVRVCAQGFACARKRVFQAGEVQVELNPEAVLELRAVDEDGEPVAGVRVQLLTPTEARRLPRVTDESGLVTDAMGLATFAGRDEGDYLLSVIAEEFLPWEATVVLGPGHNARTVTLTRGAEVAFAVKEASGDAVAGARVWVDPVARGASLGRSSECTTDEQGRCTVAALPPGHAQALVFTRDDREITQPIDIPPPAGEVEVILPSENGVEGEVVGTQHYPHAALAVVAVQAGYAATTSVAADGRFRLANLKGGQVLLKAVAADPRGARNWVLASDRFEVGHRREEVQLRLPPPLRLWGGVSAAGRACGNATLVFTSASEPEAGWSATTAADGSYQALLARPGSYVVTVTDHDTDDRAVRRLAVAGDQRWDVALDGVTLEGTVVSASTQEGVAEASVRVFDEGGRSLASAVTGAGGAFRFTNLGEGEAIIVASADGAHGQRRVTLAGRSQQVVVELGDSGELLLRLVHGSTGVPVAGVVQGVILPPSAPPWSFAQQLLPGGELRLPAPGRDPHTVVLRPARPLARTTIRLAPSRQPATVALWPEAVLEVLVPSGERAALEVRGSDGQPVAVHDAYPFFVREGAGMIVVALPPGEYGVLVRGDKPAKVYRSRVSLHPLHRSSLVVSWS